MTDPKVFKYAGWEEPLGNDRPRGNPRKKPEKILNEQMKRNGQEPKYEPSRPEHNPTVEQTGGTEARERRVNIEKVERLCTSMKKTFSKGPGASGKFGGFKWCRWMTTEQKVQLLHVIEQAQEALPEHSVYLREAGSKAMRNTSSVDAETLLNNILDLIGLQRERSQEAGETREREMLY